MKRMILSLLTVFALLGSPAFAQCGVQVQWNPIGSGYAETSNNGCIWTVILTRTALTGNVTVTVTGVNNADVEVWVKNETTIRQTFINVGGSVRDLRILRKTSDNTGPVIAQNITADRHIGWAGGSLAIEVNGVQDLITAGGDVLSRIKIDGENSSPIKHLESLEVFGDVQAGIEVSRSTLRELVVTGDLGTPTSQITILAGSQNAGSLSIDTIRARSINAVITARQEVNRIETTGGSAGNFKGSLTAADFRNSSQDAGLFIDNDMLADLDLAEQLDSPITIGRHLRGTMDFSSSIRAPIQIGGDIFEGTTQNPVWLRTQGNLIYDGVDKFGSIDVSGDVLGSIITQADLLGPITIQGNMSGLVRVLGKMGDSTNSWDGSVFVLGDSSGDITVGGSMVLDQSSVDVGTLSGKLIVDRNLRGPVTIGENGLSGQIIVNAANTDGIWDSDVSIGASIVLGPDQSQPDLAPFYERQSSDFGGGAVGLAPFNFHPMDCNPTHARIKKTADTAFTVTIEHYGPVQTSADDPLKIEESSEQCTSLWTDVTSSYAQTVVNGTRSVTVVPKAGGAWVSGRTYRFTNPAGALKCADVTGTPAAVYVSDDGCSQLHNTYWFSFQSLVFDLTGDGLIDTADASAWVVEPADFNDDLTADVVDFDLLVDEILRQ